MKRTLVHLALGGGLVLSTWGARAVAQDGPLLPGFESSTPVETDVVQPAPEPDEQVLQETQELLVPEDIRPLDANGNPQTGPLPEGVLDLPDPPRLDASHAEERPKSLWQKSTDALRNLTKPADRKTPDALKNWQMRRMPATSPPAKSPSQAAPQQALPQLPPPPAIGVEAKAPATPLPSSRRTAQAHGAKSLPQAKVVQPQVRPQPAVQPAAEDNEPRSPWERPMRVLPSRSSKYRPTPPRSR